MTPEALLRWYDLRRRDLPWRTTRDPYRIWVSEIMLQQTQVKTVLPYYDAFLERFPSVEALAEAPVDEVLARWSGLGYYRRARQLHRAAREVVARGGLPTDARGLEKLPGIGPYTAAAIASIAFGERVPVIDGNVERVLSRVLASAEDPKRAPVRRRLVSAAAELLDPRRPGDSNQALMELGATVCRPQAPDCAACPFAPGCRATAEGDPERYPPPRRRRPVERVERVVAVVEARGRVLLFRRPHDSDLLAGMWELPNVPRSEPATAAAELGRRYGGVFRLGPAAGQLRHAVTFRAILLHVHPATFEAGDTVAEGPEAAWVDPAERGRYAVSSAVEKVLDRFAGSPPGGRRR